MVFGERGSTSPRLVPNFSPSLCPEHVYRSVWGIATCMYVCVRVGVRLCACTWEYIGLPVSVRTLM